MTAIYRCFRYHKGTDFQANHNATLKRQRFSLLFQIPQRYRFSSKSQPEQFFDFSDLCCFRYHKGTDFQANHNLLMNLRTVSIVVLDTTKVQIFKQITTETRLLLPCRELFQIPQRYRFSSKSQHLRNLCKCQLSCFRYHKGTDFQANHNYMSSLYAFSEVVLDTTKVQIFKQITTSIDTHTTKHSCFRYHKGTDFQANHNYL